MAKPTNRARPWLEPEGLKKIAGWCRNGLSDKQIAKNMGVAYSTFNVWKNKYQALSEALKNSKEIVDLEIENKLKKRAEGFYYEEEKTYIEEVDGKIKKRKEIIKRYALPDTTAQIFWLKNREPNRWRNEKSDVDKEEQRAKIDKLHAQTKAIEGLSSEIENVLDLRKAFGYDD